MMTFMDVIAETLINAGTAGTDKTKAKLPNEVADALLVFKQLVKQSEYPRCRECRKPLEDIEMVRDILTPDLIVIARCHRETREVRIRRISLMATRWDKTEFVELIDKAIQGPWFFSPPPGPEVP